MTIGQVVDGQLQIPELPTPEPGLTLLEAEASQPTLALQALAVDQALLDGGHTLWIGTGRHCVTDSLTDLAPSRRILDRVRLARGFTAYQHTALLRQLPDQVTDDTALVVVPELDAHYRDDVQGGDGQAFLTRALASLARVAREHEVPVLYSRRRADEFTQPLAAAASETIEYRQTPLGPRFTGSDYETLVYELEDGWVQTTLAFWQDVLQARQPLHNTASISEGVTLRG